MKLNEILSDSFNAAEWEAKGYQLPQYDIAAVAKKTHDEPTWVHFGAGNISSASRAMEPSRRRSSLLSQKASRRISSLVRTGPDWFRFSRRQVCRW